MGKIQRCRNDCGKYITVQEDDGKWKPFDVDDDGNTLDIHNCPNSPYNRQGGGVKSGQTSSYVKKSFVSPTTTQGGQTLDTKRNIQQSSEILQELRELKTFIEQKTIIDTNIYTQQTNQIYNVIGPHLSTTGEKASTLLPPRSKERQGIIDTMSVNHGQKADEYESRKKFASETGGSLEDEEAEDEEKVETED